MTSLPNRLVQLGFAMGNSGHCQLKVKYLNGFDSINVWLEDKQLDSLINLRLYKEYDFDFAGGDDRQRFVVHFSLNHAPKFVGTDTIVVTAHIPMNFDVSKYFRDNDTADALTFTMFDSLDFVKLIDGNKVQINATNSNLGTYTLHFVANDVLGLKATGQITVIVKENQSPVALIQQDEIYVPIGKDLQFSLDSVFTDPDKGDSLTIAFDIYPHTWVKYDTSSNSLVGVPEASDTAVYVLLTATDLANNQTTKLIKFIPKDLSNRELIIYPNPADEFIKIVFPDLKANIRIWDANGKLIENKEIYSGQQINVKGLPAGVYVIEIGDKYKAKFIKY